MSCATTNIKLHIL